MIAQAAAGVVHDGSLLQLGQLGDGPLHHTPGDLELPPQVEVDLGRADGHPFLNVASAGISGLVDDLVNAQPVRGTTAFLAATLKALGRLQAGGSRDGSADRTCSPISPRVSTTSCSTSRPGGGQASQDTGPNGLPELTKEIIYERINDARVYDVLPESGTGEPIHWSFDEDEPKEITIIEQQIDGPRATIVLDVKTQSSPRARNLRQLTGQIRTEWELQTGWVLRRWEIVRTENISMKYRDLPKPQPAQNSNR